MKVFLQQLWRFIKEIFMFGIDAFMVAASREIARRFWVRLSNRGGVIAALEEPKTVQGQPVRIAANSQTNLPFLDEYRD